ncbi:MAG: type II secretion system GspH family protein [bacterium]|nr:type II secretion system GspH family protein [bacterium]
MRNSNRTTYDQHRPAGYTLIEVLIVVMILGIAAAVVTPNLSQAGVFRIQAAVRTVVADISFAQMDALGYQEQRAIAFDKDENEYTLVEVRGTTIDVENDALYDIKGPDQRYRVTLDRDEFGDVRIESVDFDGDHILIFDEIGGPVATPGSSTLSDGGSVVIAGPQSRFRIDVAAFTGRITVTQLD